MDSTAVPARSKAARAVEHLVELAPDLRGCAVLDASGDPLASSGDLEAWRIPTAELWRAADAVTGEPAEHLHVATGDAEVFAVRSGGLSIVAVAERFTLASLMIFDMRTLLSEVAAA